MREALISEGLWPTDVLDVAEETPNEMREKSNKFRYKQLWDAHLDDLELVKALTNKGKSIDEIMERTGFSKSGATTLRKRIRQDGNLLFEKPGGKKKPVDWEIRMAMSFMLKRNKEMTMPMTEQELKEAGLLTSSVHFSRTKLCRLKRELLELPTQHPGITRDVKEKILKIYLEQPHMSRNQMRKYAVANNIMEAKAFPGPNQTYKMLSTLKGGQS